MLTVFLKITDIISFPGEITDIGASERIKQNKKKKKKKKKRNLASNAKSEENSIFISDWVE